MSIGSQENLNLWRERAEVDYFTQFIKAWLAFNSWYRLTYGVDAQERYIIDRIKNEPNTVRNRIIRLLDESDDDAMEFKGHVSSLHSRLESCELRNHGNRITFSNCYIGANLVVSGSGTHNGITYTVERNIPNSPQGSILCEVILRNGGIAFQKQQNRYNLDELRSDPGFVTLPVPQRSQAEARYRSINPRLEMDLLDTRGGDIEIGLHRFCADREHIFAGIVEVIYSIRCLLFHGEAIPTSDVNVIYESAYHVLRRFLRCPV